MEAAQRRGAWSNMKIHPLPKFVPPAELQIQLAEKRKAALAILRTHDGKKRKRKWLGIPAPAKRKRNKPAIPFERKVNER